MYEGFLSGTIASLRVRELPFGYETFPSGASCIMLANVVVFHLSDGVVLVLVAALVLLRYGDEPY